MSDNIVSLDNQAQTVVTDITMSQEPETEMQASEDNEHNEKLLADTLDVNQHILSPNEQKMRDESSSYMVEKNATEQPTKTKPTENSTQNLHTVQSDKLTNPLSKEDEDNHQQIVCSIECDINTAGLVTGQKNIVQDMKKLDIVDKSENSVIINKQSNSLKNLMNYDSSNSSSEDSEDDSEDNSSTDSESESDTTVEVSDDDNSDSDVEEVATLNRKNNSNTRKAPSTTDIFDPVDFSLLPDLKKLSINYEKEEFLRMGHVKAIILDTVVTVEALPGIPAYNLDTILFMKEPNDQKHHPLGVVDDVIGPVESPLYCLRFQTAEELTEKGVTVGMEVYVAPKNDCTKYVFIKELMKIKGSDASWIGDKELPPEMAKESDEESECDVDEARKAPKRKFGHQQDPKKMSTNDSNSRFSGRPRRGFQRAPGHFPVPFHSHQNMQVPNFHEHGPAPNYNSPAPFDPSQPPPMLPPQMHPPQGSWRPPPPPVGGQQFGPPMMRGSRYPPRRYGSFVPGPYGPGPCAPGSGPFGPGPSERPF